MGRPRVVIVGAGFGGLSAARALRDVEVDVVIIDRHNYHLFQPLLYQVATGLLNPAEIAHPVRNIVRRQRNSEIRLAEAIGIDLNRRVLHTDVGSIAYDQLIVAAGSVTNFFGDNALAASTIALKSLDDATRLRSTVLERFERAAETADAAERRRLLSFVVAGGGPTGVECAGALMELFAHVLPREYHELDFDSVRLFLVEGNRRLLDTFHPRLAAQAAAVLTRRGVQLRLSRHVVEASAAGIRLDDGEEIEAATVVWTAGVRAAPLGAALSQHRTPLGRVPVLPTLQLPGREEVQVIGDLANVEQAGAVLPMLAPVAMQQGDHAARNIAGSLHGLPAQRFHYRDKGTMATVGRNVAVAQIGPLRIGGLVGWLMWLFIHLAQIVTFRSKLMVLLSWGWNYVFYDRPIRLITNLAPRSPTATPPVEV